MKRKRLIVCTAITVAVCCVVAVLCYFIIAGKPGEHVHKLIAISRKGATCTKDGHAAYYMCGGCDKWFEDAEGTKEITDRESTVLPKGHKITLVERKEATCTEDGNSAYYICGVCNKWYEDSDGKTEIADKESVVLAKGHKMTPVERKEATCTEDGCKAYFICGVCDKWYEDRDGKAEIADKDSVVLAKGHKLSPVEGKEATCTSDGNSAYYSCGVCDKWFEDGEGKDEITDKSGVVIAKGHKLTPVEGIKATCTVKGRSAYYECSVCDRWFNDGEGKVEITDKSGVILQKEPHKYKDGACTECGLRTPTEGLTYIAWGNYAEVFDFGDVTDSEIVIAEEYEGKPVTHIGNEAFYGSGVTKICLPDSITSIGNRAFLGTYLTDIIFSDNLTSIGNEAFYGTDFTDIILPDSLISIGDSAFGECYKLKSIKIPYGVVSIGEYAFEDCEKLTSVIIPDSVTSLGRSAFLRCKSLTDVTVSAGVKVIEIGVFEQCDNLKSVNIRGNVTDIKGFAFADCYALKSITLPGSVTRIGENAFSGCTELTDITFKGTKSQWLKIIKDESWDSYTEDYTIHCTNGDIKKD